MPAYVKTFFVFLLSVPLIKLKFYAWQSQALKRVSLFRKEHWIIQKFKKLHIYLNSAVSKDSSSMGATLGTFVHVLGTRIFTFLTRKIISSLLRRFLEFHLLLWCMYCVWLKEPFFYKIKKLNQGRCLKLKAPKTTKYHATVPLKGQSHEIFLLWFFSSICSFWSY